MAFTDSLCYFVRMDGDDDAETGMMTPEERHRWRARRAHRGLPQYPQWPISAKTLRAEAKAKARRKKRLRRKRDGSVQRRKVGRDDGRRARVKALKAEGQWPPPLMNLEDDADDAMEISAPPPPIVHQSGLQLKPRVEQGTERKSFSEGRIKQVVIEKRDRVGFPGRGLPEPLPQALNVIPTDKV